MAKKNKSVLNVTIDGEDKEIAVVRPNNTEWQEGMRVYSNAWAQALRGGALLTEAIEPYLKEQNIWGEEQKNLLRANIEQIAELEQKLIAGKMSKSEGREIALKIRDLRFDQRDIIGPKADVEMNSVQSLAEQARFDYLVSVCTVYNDTGERVFSSLEEYKERANGDEEWVWKCGAELNAIVNNVDPDYQKNLVENKFLVKYGFANDKLQLINKDGHLVSRDWKLIDEQGFYVNENGQRVDVDGNLVETGSIDDAEFYD